MVIIEIVNDGTGDEIEAHYDVVIKVNAQIIYQFRIESHNRLSGIQGLLGCLAKDFCKADSRAEMCRQSV